MSYQTPIGNQPRDPYEKYRVEPIEADKKTKDEERKREEEAKKPFLAILAGYLIFLFRQILDLFEDTSETGIGKGARQHIKDNLLLIKADLERLKREDLSQDSPFLNRLSEHWHQALEDTFRFRKDTHMAHHFKIFIKTIDAYPKGESFSFGYYLLEYAGQKWLPFPYMDLIRKIHDEHQKNPKSSALAHWTELIDELAQMMMPE